MNELTAVCRAHLIVYLVDNRVLPALTLFPNASHLIDWLRELQARHNIRPRKQSEVDFYVSDCTQPDKIIWRNTCP